MHFRTDVCKLPNHGTSSDEIWKFQFFNFAISHTTFDTITSFPQAIDYLYHHIPHAADQSFPGELGLARTQHFLELFGNPQEKYPVIHIAGTSGKGSTAYFISQLLQSHGFKVGFHISPHLIDIRERMQINSQLISESDFCQSLNKLIPVINRLKKSKYGTPTYFEVSVVLSYFVFWKKNIDYAVIETGMGGLYDATNTVKKPSKVALLTTIGHDHMHILGKTLPEIAYQKAMIMQRGNHAFAFSPQSSVRKVFDTVAQKQHATINYLDEKNVKHVKNLPDFSTFDWIDSEVKLKQLKLGMRGKHQIKNCSLALAALFFLSRRDKFVLDQERIRQTLATIQFPGRLEVTKIKGTTVVIDGAHNPQKMSACINSLKHMFPGKKFSFLIAFKKEKDIKHMLKKITSVAEHIVVTQFFNNEHTLKHLVTSTEEIGATLKQISFSKYQLISDPLKALDYALKEKPKILVITGSLYLVGVLYQKLKSTSP